MTTDRRITSTDSYVLTVDGTVVAGQVVADLRGSVLTADALQRGANLADLTDVSAARTNLGVTATGREILTAPTGDAAMTAMGMTNQGRDLVKTTGVGMRAYLGLLSFPVSGCVPDIVSANAASIDIFVGGAGGHIMEAWAASSVPIATGDLVFTLKYGAAVLPTIGGMQFKIAVGATTGHAQYDVGADVVNGNVPLTVVVSGGNTAAGIVNMTIDVQTAPLF